MAENSIREKLILADIAIIQSISAIKTSVRRLQSYSDLQDFAVTQFPVVATVGRLPTIEYKRSSRHRPELDLCSANLKVDFFVYFQSNEDSDTQLSNLVDDLWKNLHLDPTRGGLCTETTLQMEENIEVFYPFGAFRFTAIHIYNHSIGGI